MWTLEGLDVPYPSSGKTVVATFGSFDRCVEMTIKQFPAVAGEQPRVCLRRAMPSGT